VLYLAPSSSCRSFNKCIYKVCAKLSAKSKEMAFSKASKQPLVRHALRPRPIVRYKRFITMASISSCKSFCPLSGVKRCPLFGGSGCISYIGRSAGAKARRPLDGGVRYLECPLYITYITYTTPIGVYCPQSVNGHNVKLFFCSSKI
jgi:hypothetical protein